MREMTREPAAHQPRLSVLLLPVTMGLEAAGTRERQSPLGAGGRVAVRERSTMLTGNRLAAWEGRRAPCQRGPDTVWGKLHCTGKFVLIL